MQQAISTAISNAILDWRDAETVQLIEFPFKAISKQAPGRGHQKRPETKTFEQMVAEVAQEQINQKAEDDHLGIRIAFWVTKRNQDLDNLEKSINDGLKQIAFKDDHVFDYVEKVRVKAPAPDKEGFTVEILRLVEKRNPWV